MTMINNQCAARKIHIIMYQRHFTTYWGKHLCALGCGNIHSIMGAAGLTIIYTPTAINTRNDTLGWPLKSLQKILSVSFYSSGCFSQANFLTNTRQSRFGRINGVVWLGTPLIRCSL